MELHGQNIIGAKITAANGETYQGVDPASGRELDPLFHEAGESEINRALEIAEEAFHSNRDKSPEERALLLEHIAGEIESLGDQLVKRVHAETALGADRIRGERQRTVDQLRMFADLVREGSWVDARIDGEIRRMLIPLGPVAVFGASNFPLAFSVAGGDTASALAAGCPVIVKAHPAHPGTSELVARAIRAAVDASGFHAGTFSLLHGRNPQVSITLVEHPLTKAVGFTGSLRAGRAIFDAAASRPKPIPVYAEMGSVNPVFILPGALQERSDNIAAGLAESVTLGAGQFCTNPGLVFGFEGEDMDRFVEQTANQLSETPSYTMLYEGICSAYKKGIKEMKKTKGVQVAARVEADSGSGTEAGAVVFTTKEETFLKNSGLHEEVFGPSTLLVQAASAKSLEDIAQGMEGNLTASIHGTEKDLREHSGLVRILENKVGRLIFNDFPTGVKVCPSMHHGGPYPATTDVRSTSVGTAAIERFACPVCYQNFPQEALPAELQDQNKRNIWRLLDGAFSRESYIA